MGPSTVLLQRSLEAKKLHSPLPYRAKLDKAELDGFLGVKARHRLLSNYRQSPLPSCNTGPFKSMFNPKDPLYQPACQPAKGLDPSM